MADIIRIPGGVNITTGVGDQLDITVIVKQDGDPVDISGWQLEATNATLTLSDPANGEIRLGFTSTFPTLQQWVLRRAASPAKRLLAGYVQYVTAAGSSTPGDVIEVTLEDAPDVVLEIADFVTSIALPPGGDQYALLEKASAGDFDTQWTDKPTVKGVRFDTANAASLDQAGDIGWDDLDQALAYRTNGLTVDIAQENLVYVRNPPNSTSIPKGAAVAVKGASANRLEAQLCDATAGANLGCRTLGVAMTAIPSPGFGFVSTFGLLRGFNTGAIVGGGVAEGSELFISSTPGVMSTQPQASPGRRVTVGYVVTTGVNGSIFVTVRRGLTVDELDNVLAASPAGGDVLEYSSANSRWENRPDYVRVTNPQAGDLIYRTAQGWERLAPGTEGQVLAMISGVPTWISLPAGIMLWQT
jgi:hypothetical protein